MTPLLRLSFLCLFLTGAALAETPIKNINLTGTVKIGGTTLLPTVTELNFVDGVTSAVQTQMDLRAPLISPSFTTPSLGVATATSINKLTITTPATGSTLTVADGKTLTASNTLTLAGTDSSTLNIGTGGTLGTSAYITLGANVGTFLTTPSSANLLAATTDETGTGSLVFANTPTLVTPVIGAATGTSLSLTGSGTFGRITISANEIYDGTANGTDGIYMNFKGYLGGTTQFRDFYVHDGKTAEVAKFTGSTKTLSVVNVIQSAELRTDKGAASGYNVLAQSGGAGVGYIEWRKGDTTRLGYMGNGATDIDLNLENSAAFAVSGGNMTVSGSVTSAGLTSTAANTFSGGETTISTNGAASVPPLKLSGTWYAAGTATTNKPQILAEPTGTTSTGWSVSGTGIGANAASGFVGNLIDLQLAGVSKFRVTSTGNVYGATINSDVNTDLVTAYSVVATGGLTVGGGTGIAKILSSVKSAFDCPSIAAGGEQTTTMTITGATTSSTVTVTPSAALPAGLPLPYARCTAADSITIYAPNPSAGALDPASMDYRVTVINF